MTGATAIIVPCTIEDAVTAIHAKFAEAITHEKNANRARIEAGRMLIALRMRIENGEAGEVEWWDWYGKNFVRCRRDAERVWRWPCRMILTRH